MIKIETIMMPYVEYPLKAHKKYKAKIKKALKKSVLEEIINEDMHVYKTDYAVPQDLEKPYRSILRTFLDEAMGYITYSLGYSKTQVLHLFATEMKKNDAIDWGTYGSNFTGIYAFDIPDEFVDPQDEKDGGKRGENNYLRYLTYEGAKKRYGEISDEIRERLDFELLTIEKTGYPGYFLIVQDFTTEAHNMGVSVGPGRGSAAGSNDSTRGLIAGGINNPSYPSINTIEYTIKQMPSYVQWVIKVHPSEIAKTWSTVVNNYKNVQICHGDLLNLLSASSVIISWYSTVIFEAVLMQRPVVSFSIPGCMEHVSYIKDGLVVHANTIEEVADVTLELLTNFKSTEFQVQSASKGIEK